jgi:hypothetical protein
MMAISEKLEKCAICRDEKSPETMARLSPCDHLFDAACIDQWLGLHNDCPYCRRTAVQLTVNGEIRPIADPAGAVAAANEAMQAMPTPELNELLEAVNHGDLDAVNELLARENFSPEARHSALSNLREANGVEIANAILANGPIPNNYRETAILSAVSRGNLAVATHLLEGFVISTFGLFSALSEAVDENRVRIIEFLLSTVPISSQNQAELILEIAERGSAETSILMYAATLRYASENGDLDIASASLANGQISEASLTEARHLAQQNGHQAIVDLLRARENQIRRSSNFRISMIAGFAAILFARTIPLIYSRFFNET